MGDARSTAELEASVPGPVQAHDRGRPWELLAFLLLAVWVFRRLWADPTGSRLASSFQDQAQHEWFLAWGAHALASGVDPFVTEVLNSPDGVNLLANTSLLGLAVPLAPVTWLFGPAVSYATAMTLGLAATAAGWSAVLLRAVPSRLGAAVGGGMCAFAPAMLAHANAHLNFAAQFLVPWIVWATVRLREEGRSVRGGVTLGLLVAWQFTVGAEVLTYTALATGLFVAVWALLRREQARPLLAPFGRGLATAAATAAVLLAYPIWVQFQGPYTYGGLDDVVVDFANDLAAFPATPVEDVPAGGGNWALNVVEQNAHLGWGVLLLAAVAAVWLRRSAVVAAAVVTGVVFAALSLGREVTVAGTDTGVPGPWALAGELPLLDHIPPSRLSMVCIPVLGLLAATAVARLRQHRRGVRAAAALALVVALLPWAPAGKEVVDRAVVPAFFTSGDWRQHLDDGGTVVPVPVPSPTEVDAYAWQVAADFDVVLPGGYFLYPQPDGVGSWGAPPRPTGTLLLRVLAGEPVTVTAQDRRDAGRDLAYWRADAVVLPVTEPRAAALRAVLSDLLGRQPTRVDDVLLWTLPED